MDGGPPGDFVFAAGEAVSDAASALHERARAEAAAGDREAAVATWSEVVDLRRANGAAAGLAHALRHLGHTLLELGRPGEAEPALVEALALTRSGGVGGVTLANAVRPVALLREGQGRVDEARALWIEARALYAAAGIDAGVGECDDHLG